MIIVDEIKNNNDINWKEQIEKITKETIEEKWGFKVIFKKMNESYGFVEFDKIQVVVATNMILERQFYILVHELGHIIQQKGHEEYYKTQFKSVFNSFKKDSACYKLKIIEEEIDSWNLGFIFAKEEGYKFNKRAYEVFRAKCIGTYVISSLKL